jgi:hypothetical protein
MLSMEAAMQACVRILLPVTLVTSIIGAVAGYSLYATSAARVFAYHPEVAPIRVSQTTKIEASSSAAWRQQPSLMDTSWKRWPSLTDF